MCVGVRLLLDKKKPGTAAGAIVLDNAMVGPSSKMIFMSGAGIVMFVC